MAPRTPFGVRSPLRTKPGVARYRSLTPGYLPTTPPAWKGSPAGCQDISPRWSEATPGVILRLKPAPR